MARPACAQRLVYHANSAGRAAMSVPAASRRRMAACASGTSAYARSRSAAASAMRAGELIISGMVECEQSASTCSRRSSATMRQSSPRRSAWAASAPRPYASAARANAPVRSAAVAFSVNALTADRSAMMAGRTGEQSAGTLRASSRSKADWGACAHESGARRRGGGTAGAPAQRAAAAAVSGPRTRRCDVIREAFWQR
jgi:hypothetical protein